MTEVKDKKLNASERERAIFACLDVGVVIHAPDTSIIFSNPRASEILGLTEDQLKGKKSISTDWKFLREDKTPLPIDEYPVTQISANKKLMRNILLGINRPNTNEIRWVNINGIPMFDNTGEISEIIISFIDITERKQTEEALKESESYFRVMFNEAPLGIALIDSLNGKLFSVNPMFAKIAGKTLEEMSSIDWMSITHPDDIQKDLDQMALMNAGKINGFQMEKRYLHKDGTNVWINMTIAPLKIITTASPCHLCMIEEITERKKIENDLLQAKLDAESASLIKSRFLDIAAHELRTPVTSFSLLLQLTQKQLEKGFPFEPSVLTRLRKQADRISHLVVDLLDVSRLERGVVKLNLEHKDLNLVITDCVDDLLLRDPGRIVKIIKTETPVELHFDNLRIAQVISNLLENAQKFSPINSSIEISVDTKPGHVRVFIKDHGPGISIEQQSVLFTAFTRGDVELTSRSGGLGLGLYICSEIIKLHGGTIGVKSKMGEGSTFYFELLTGEVK